MDKTYYVYILASRKNGTLYIGVTGDIVGRTWEHKHDVFKGFTSKYGVKRLVWYEEHSDPGEAIYREKQLKEWHRAWKIRLIEAMNPDWNDLYNDFWRDRPTPTGHPGAGRDPA